MIPQFHLACTIATRRHEPVQQIRLGNQDQCSGALHGPSCLCGAPGPFIEAIGLVIVSQPYDRDSLEGDSLIGLGLQLMVESSIHGEA